jgi:hypothetical protein
MRPATTFRLGAALAAPALLLLGPAPWAVRGDEPGLFGRLFRLGGSSTPPPATATAPDLPSGATVVEAPSLPAATGPATSAPQPRLIPQPRNYRGVTDADPILTRVTLVRSNEGGQFGMFLQAVADGTVIDGEGVHHLGREAVRPLLDVLQSGDLYRLKGHCGGPPTDFAEHVHIVVYERSLGRLRAYAFSFSGNPQGCDPSVRRLQGVLDVLQTRLSPPAASATAGTSPAPIPAPAATSPAPAVISPSSPRIRLNGGNGSE